MGDPPDICCTVDEPCDDHLRSSLSALSHQLDLTYTRLSELYHSGEKADKEDHWPGRCNECSPCPDPVAIDDTDEEIPF